MRCCKVWNSMVWGYCIYKMFIYLYYLLRFFVSQSFHPRCLLHCWIIGYYHNIESFDEDLDDKSIHTKPPLINRQIWYFTNKAKNILILLPYLPLSNTCSVVKFWTAVTSITKSNMVGLFDMWRYQQVLVINTMFFPLLMGLFFH